MKIIKHATKKCNNLYKKEWFFILIIIILTRLLLFTVGDISYTWMEHNPEQTVSEISGSKFIDMWYNWDARGYYDFSVHGYKQQTTFPDGEQYAFFPFITIISKPFFYITGNSLITGILLANAFLFIGLIYFSKLLRMTFSKKFTRTALLFVLVFPSSIFLSLFYTEPIFFALITIATYYFVNGKFLITGITGALLSATRNLGILLFPAMVGEYVIESSRKIFTKKKLLYLLIMPLGLLSYMIFLKIRTGNPLYFVTIQQNWNRSVAFGTQEHLARMIHVFTNFSLGNIINMSFFIFAILACIWAWNNWNKSLALFGIMAVSIPLLTGTSFSMNRFVLPIIPMYVFLSYIAEKYEFSKEGLIIGSSILMGLWTILFVNGYWIA